MSDLFEVDPASPERAQAALEAATAALADGGLVVLPTETVYGVACRPDDREATRRLFEAKRRSPGLNLPVLAATVEQAWDVAVPTASARRLAAAFWPGPLTMVLVRSDRSRPWDLGAERATVGVRVPEHRLTAALLGRAGPLAATSANRSGSPPLQEASALVEAFGGLVAVFLVLPPGAGRPGGTPSTVVDLTEGHPRIRRRGPISFDAIRSADLAGAPGPHAGGSR